MGRDKPTPSTPVTPLLEVRAGKNANRFGVAIYSIALIALPILGWVAFGPETPGDTTNNGNSILAFWIMRALLFAGWIYCLIGFKRSFDLLKHLPILFTLDEFGIKNRVWNLTTWAEIETIFYVRGDLNLKVRSRSGDKIIVMKSEELGFRSMDKIDAFIREHAPPHLTKDL